MSGNFTLKSIHKCYNLTVLKILLKINHKANNFHI